MVVRLFDRGLLFAFSGMFSGYGLLILVKAYREDDSVAWRRLVSFGAICVLLGTALADLAMLLMVEVHGPS